MSEIQFTNLERVLGDYGLRVVDKYRRLLATPIRKGRSTIAPTDATGKLSRSVHPVLERQGDRYLLIIDFGVEYWHWLEYGTRQQGPYRRQGKFPPVSSIYDWVRHKPVIPYKSNGRMPTQRQVAFLIARKIYNEGTPALHFLEQSEENFERISELCQQAAQQDIENWIKELTEYIYTI